MERRPTWVYRKQDSPLRHILFFIQIVDIFDRLLLNENAIVFMDNQSE